MAWTILLLLMVCALCSIFIDVVVVDSINAIHGTDYNYRANDGVWGARRNFYARRARTKATPTTTCIIQFDPIEWSTGVFYWIDWRWWRDAAGQMFFSFSAGNWSMLIDGHQFTHCSYLATSSFRRFGVHSYIPLFHLFNYASPTSTRRENVLWTHTATERAWMRVNHICDDRKIRTMGPLTQFIRSRLVCWASLRCGVSKAIIFSVFFFFREKNEMRKPRVRSELCTMRIAINENNRFHSIYHFCFPFLLGGAVAAAAVAAVFLCLFHNSQS